MAESSTQRVAAVEDEPVLAGGHGGDHLGKGLHAMAVVAPRSITALILRVRALVADWIQDEIEEESISGAEGIVSNNVVGTFYAAGGDLGDAVPFALLEARKSFVAEANEGRKETLNELRALTCEVLARRLVAYIEAPARQGQQGTQEGGEDAGQVEKHARDGHHVTLCKRFSQLDDDGDETLPTSALESAVDQGCVSFLACHEAQRCANELWKGKLVQNFAPSGQVFFQPYDPKDRSFLGRLDPGRLTVPRYSYYAGLAIHVAFIVIYTFSTLEYTGLDSWEIVLWIFAAGYLLDDLTRWFKMGGMDKVISFWVVVDLCTDVLFITSFSFRMAGWFEREHHRSSEYRLLAFQFLSCIAPLLWMQLLKLADGIQYFGVIQIVLLRMLQETAAFFLLLLLTAIGFAQSLFALDAADGHRVKSSGAFVANLLAATIMGNPDFDAPGKNFGQPFGKILMYFYAFITLMLLSNILVAFFASAYDKTVDDADDVFRAYFCSKVVSTIRAPDQFVYLPPFNLVEAFFVAPFEFVLPRRVYATINRYIQSTLFCLPLAVIALHESRREVTLAKRIRLEMLDDMPEERMRRLAQAAGIDDVRNPGLNDAAASDVQGSKSTGGAAYMLREEFESAAQKYADSSPRPDTGREDVDLGAHLYAQGWAWQDGNNPPYTGHLERTFTVAMPVAVGVQNGDDGVLESMGVEERAHTDLSSPPEHERQAVQMLTLTVTQTVAYAATWKVPILYIEASKESGEPLPIDELCASPLFVSKEAQAASSEVLSQDTAAFPMVSMGENPANGHTCAYLHPCETAASVAQVLNSGDSKASMDSQDTALAYLEAFIMLCSTAVEMRPGSKTHASAMDGGQNSTRGGAVITSVHPGTGSPDDLVISRTSFKSLLDRLPSTEGKDPDSDEKHQQTSSDTHKPAESSADLSLLLNELRALRSEISELKRHQ